jgi:Tfp pilus assembly protein PilW
MSTTTAVSKTRIATANPASRQLALTLVEMMVTMGVFSLVLIGVLYSHVFGLKQDQLVESKLGASETARRDFGQIARDIRSAKMWQVGNMSGTTFVDLPDGTNQIGNALQLNLTADPTISVLYYFGSVGGDNKLFRLHTGDTVPTVIASNLIDTLSFTAEDYAGTTIQTLQWRYVIHFTLKFRQYQYPLTMVGTNYLYDLYKIEFRLTPHSPD